MNLDWLIIGGGIHGVHIAARLLGEASVSPDRLRIVDPGDRLLARWRAYTATTGMDHLRSPVVHHLDLRPWSLRRFAGKRKSRGTGLFAPPYDRPALALFNAHCDHVVETFGLSDLHVQDRAMSCSVDCDGVGVQLAGGREVAAQQLVLAIGAASSPSGRSGRHGATLGYTTSSSQDSTDGHRHPRPSWSSAVASRRVRWRSAS